MRSMLQSSIVPGGQAKADEELRKLHNSRPDLQKHVQWYQEVRAYDKK